MVATAEACDVFEGDESQYQKGVKHLCEKVISRVPSKYILPVDERPGTTVGDGTAGPDAGRKLVSLPVVDFAELRSLSDRPGALESLARACEQYGFFQVGVSPFGRTAIIHMVCILIRRSHAIFHRGPSPSNAWSVHETVLIDHFENFAEMQLVNHGIPNEVISSMIDASTRFFGQPYEERAKYMSSDMASLVRYGTSFNQNRDKVFCWRDFLKITCQPMSQVLPHWPSSPADMRYTPLTWYLYGNALRLGL